MIPENILSYHLILASRSPRRIQLLKESGFEFETYLNNDEDEEYPAYLKNEEIPVYISGKKMNKLSHLLVNNNLVITADTIVWFDGKALGKPNDLIEAKEMLNMLSGKKHTVYTGVCLASAEKKHSFFDETDVYFREFSSDEIHYYVEKFKPLDKAGAYGAQEWIGYIGVQKINGSYFNVMGLPLQLLYEQLSKF